MNKMESLDSLKFNQLSLEEMTSLNGGWGCHIEETKISIHPELGEMTISYAQRYNIFGKPTGEWKAIED